MMVNVTRYTSAERPPATVNTGLRSPRLARVDRGTARERGTAPRMPNATTPSRSPSMPSTWLGQQLQRVEHRQEIPLRPDAGRHGRERVRLPPELPRIERRQRREHRERDVPREHVAQDVVREERHLRQAFARLQRVLDGERHAHALALHEQQVQRQERRRDRRQDRDVQAVEPRQRRAGHVVAAAQQAEHEVADDRHRAGDAGADFRREERQLVPRQQVAAEAEAEHQEQQQRRSPTSARAASGTT